MARLGPEATSQEIFAVLFGLLFMDPLVFLAVCCDFERETAYVEEGAEDVRQGDSCGEGGKEGGRQGIERENGHKLYDISVRIQ